MTPLAIASAVAGWRQTDYGRICRTFRSGSRACRRGVTRTLPQEGASAYAILRSMRKMRCAVALVLATCGAAALAADEGMWRIDQLPLDVIAGKYGVRLTSKDLERLQYPPVRLVPGRGGAPGPLG